MGGKFREVECEDEGVKVRQRKEILLQLIVEYEEEINKGQLLAL